MRIGTKNRPFYRIVAVDDRKKRTGGYLDLIGTYNPLTSPKEIKIDQDKVDSWVKKGAQLSHGFLRIIGKAAQKPPRKPRNDKGNSAAAETPAAPAAAPAEPEVAAEEPVVADAVTTDTVESVVETQTDDSADEETSAPEAEVEAAEKEEKAEA